MFAGLFIKYRSLNCFFFNYVSTVYDVVLYDKTLHPIYFVAWLLNKFVRPNVALILTFLIYLQWENKWRFEKKRLSKKDTDDFVLFSSDGSNRNTSSEFLKQKQNNYNKALKMKFLFVFVPMKWAKIRLNWKWMWCGIKVVGIV